MKIYILSILLTIVLIVGAFIAGARYEHDKCVIQMQNIQDELQKITMQRQVNENTALAQVIRENNQLNDKTKQREQRLKVDKTPIAKVDTRGHFIDILNCLSKNFNSNIKCGEL